MAGRIRQEDIEQVRERTDIIKLVSGYLTLKRSGHDSFSGLCPFHTEKSPSFSVSPSKGVYYCFGCGQGGDAIRFLREVEHLDFSEAVERLAKETGITVRYEGESPSERRAAGRRQALNRANEEAFDLYHRMLVDGREGEDARRYLAERGIDAATAERFTIGYAPGYADFLLRRLAKTLSTEILVEAGLALRDDAGNVRDRFRGRITFPVRDLSGRAVGIGARILPPSEDAASPRSANADGPKYLNSPETPIYRKGEVLYNLDRAKSAVARSGEIHVVEGYTDVIALEQAGIETAVATCGTALGEGHFRLASRFAQRMILLFDGDEAGARAAERAFQFLETFPLQPIVLILPQGQDPADFVRANGADALRELANGGVPLVEYMLRRTVARHPLTTVEGQTAAVTAGLPMLESLGDPVRRSEYAHVLAELTGVTESSVALALEQRMTGRPVEIRESVKRASAQERVEREMLRLLARDRDTFRGIAPKLEADHFQMVRNRDVFSLLLEVDGDLAGTVARSQDDKIVTTLSALALEPVDGEPTLEYAEDVCARLHEFALKRRSTSLRQELQKLNPQTDERYDKLFQELIEIDGELRRLRQRFHGL